jgi:drug/metabolite transporter (DMT)-like permease
MLQLHLAVVLFGLTGLLGKYIGLPAEMLVFGRTAWAGVVLSLYALLAGRRLKWRTARDAAELSLQGVLLAGVWFSFFHSIQLSTVAVGLVSFSTFPMFVMFLEPWCSGERLRPAEVCAAAGISAGMLLLVPEFRLENEITRGACWGVGSGFLCAVLLLLNRRCAASYPPLVSAWYQDVFAACTVLPFVVHQLPLVGRREFFLLGVLGVLCTAVAQSLFLSSLNVVRAQLASLVVSLEPVYGIVFAFVLLGEVPSWRTLVGGTVIFGVVIVQQVFHFRRQPGKRETPLEPVSGTTASSFLPGG